MKKIKNHIYTNTQINSQILKSLSNNYEQNRKKYFSPQEPNNKFTQNKKIFYPINQNSLENIDNSSPFNSTTNNFYKIKNRYSNHKKNRLSEININNNITIDKLAKRRKNYNSNQNITIPNNTNFLKTSKTQRYITVSNINNYSLSGHNNKKESQNQKDCTNLLIEKTETQYPLTTYYFLPANNNFLSPFNKELSPSGKNIKSVRNKKIDISISQEFNSQNNYFSPIPKSICRSETESNIKSCKQRGIRHFNSMKNYMKNINNGTISPNTYYNTYKIDFNQNFGCINYDLRNEYYHCYKKDNFLYNKNNNRNFYMKKRDIIKNIYYFIKYIKDVINKKLYKIKEEFFHEISKNDFYQSMNYININNFDNTHAINKLRIKKKNDLIVPFKKISNNNSISVRKKDNNHIYRPKKNIDTNNNLSKNYCSININNPKNVTFKIQNNFNNKENNYYNTNTSSNFKQYIDNNTNKSKINEKNMLSFDMINDSILNNNKVFSARKIKEEHTSSNIAHKKKRIIKIDDSLSLDKKIYQKKLGRNLTNKKFPYKARLLSNIFNEKVNYKSNLKNKIKNEKNKNKNAIVNKDKKENKKKKENKIFNINIDNGMLINHSISSDEKLFINVKYVILINKRKNNNKKNTSFNINNFKIIKNDNFYMSKNIISIITNRSKNKNINPKTENNNIIPVKIEENEINIKPIKKEENIYKKKKIIFINYLKINSFFFIIKKFFNLLLFKKLKFISNKSYINKEAINIHKTVGVIRNNGHESNENDILSENNISGSPRDKSNRKLIKVKKVKQLKKIPKKQKSQNKIENKININTFDYMRFKVFLEKIKNINEKIFEKKIKIYFNKWKNIHNVDNIDKNEDKKNEINKNNYIEENQKLNSTIKNLIFVLRVSLIYFSLNNKKINTNDSQS